MFYRWMYPIERYVVLSFLSYLHQFISYTFLHILFQHMHIMNALMDNYKYLARLKGYVRNRAQPEGSMAEGYIA